ncbi:MAG: DUF1836 domain-containing protein [Lachnospiraceae bacterium]|nr:DUF1836 domain-containing protein [Lachnospiraceae bacterium]MDE6625731.1 DUF1836 domain-containing protein [Lachnospiraceae bacterium]
MSQLTFEEIKAQIEEWIRLDYIYPEDIPSIELYMDQVTTFMEEHLRGNKRREDDKILTKTMINNYSKNNLLPPSDKKKYSKDHMILLIYIYYLKNFLSINDIQNLLNPMTNTFFHKDSGITMSDIYSDLFELEKQYGIKVRQSIQDVYDITDKQFDTKDDYLKTYAMITMLSYDIYAKKQLVEKLIDSLADKSETKEEQKERKEAARQQEKAEKEQAKKQDKRTKKDSTSKAGNP